MWTSSSLLLDADLSPPSDADVLSSDCDTFPFFTALCSLRFDVHCVLFFMASDYAYRRFNYVAIAVCMIVLMSVLLCLCRMTVIFDIVFF